MPKLFDSPLAIIDVETTGMSYKNGGVIDIGILRIENGQVVQTMQQLVNPGAPLPAFITQLTGINNNHVADAPHFGDIARDVYELLEECIFVAHNARFDYAFIKEEFARVGYRYQPKQLCTVKLSKSLYPQFRSHKLDALIERFNLQVEHRHRAFGDAQATWQALQIMADQHPAEVFDAKAFAQIKQPSIPSNLPAETIGSLPSTPGVYIFTSKNGATLYVGKSVNVRSRVLSHFGDDHRSVKEMRISQEIADVQVVPASGELGALLKESQLIKELMPLHNRMLRRQTEMVIAVREITLDGYPTISIQRHASINSHSQNNEKAQSPSVSLDHVMAIYKSERQAKESLLAVAKEHRLCHRLLGLQKTNGACFMHQLKACHGACVGKESSLEYLFRYNQAFASTRLKQWPFSTPIIITESLDGERSTGYVVDNWVIISVIEQRDQQVDVTHIDPLFDLDQYKILKRYIENPQNQHRIQPYQQNYPAEAQSA